MSKIKGLLTINKSKDTAVEIKTIGDLKIALEQDIMRYESKTTTKVKNNINKFTRFVRQYVKWLFAINSTFEKQFLIITVTINTIIILCFLAVIYH